MSSTRDASHPLGAPEEYRRVAHEGAQGHVEMISDYLAIKDEIPTGGSRREKIAKTRQRIPRLLDGSDHEWIEWNWQLHHLVRDTNLFGQNIDFVEPEKADIDKTATQHRWSARLICQGGGMTR